MAEAAKPVPIAATAVTSSGTALSSATTRCGTPSGTPFSRSPAERAPAAGQPSHAAGGRRAAGDDQADHDHYVGQLPVLAGLLAAFRVPFGGGGRRARCRIRSLEVRTGHGAAHVDPLADTPRSATRRSFSCPAASQTGQLCAPHWAAAEMRPPRHIDSSLFVVSRASGKVAASPLLFSGGYYPPRSLSGVTTFAVSIGIWLMAAPEFDKGTLARTLIGPCGQVTGLPDRRQAYGPSPLVKFLHSHRGGKAGRPGPAPRARHAVSPGA
jgi:hypothetical protein